MGSVERKEFPAWAEPWDRHADLREQLTPTLLGFGLFGRRERPGGTEYTKENLVHDARSQAAGVCEGRGGRRGCCGSPAFRSAGLLRAALLPLSDRFRRAHGLGFPRRELLPA